MLQCRTEKFMRNELLEKLLFQLNGDLQLSEQKLIEHFGGQAIDCPLILVMGPLRSGTTLFLQWLANTGIVAYPTNLLSRFYQAPIIGAKIQLLLTDPRYNFREELGEFAQQVEYKSENGKTRGVLAPNEFWYFWRRFLAEPSHDVWSDEELRQTMDVHAMKAELAGVMDVFQKPFAAKGLLFNYNIPFLDSIFEKVIFVQMRREPVANVASILEARKRQLGKEEAWYSFKIPEYESLKDLDPISQCAGQVKAIDRAVSAGLAKVSERQKLVVQYEEFCANPHVVFEKLKTRLEFGNTPVYSGPKKFKPTREDNLPNRGAIQKALALFP
jgi:LPS sulfotransferase NodH